MRRLSAFILLLLFAFIHAEKAFHKHRVEQKIIFAKAIGNSAINASCAICDFQVSKDAELPALAVIAVPVLSSREAYSFVIPSYRFLLSDPISNRGPPAC